MTLTTCLALVCSGCSFVFTKAPPEHAERAQLWTRVDCSTSKAPPILDALFTGFQVLRTGLAATADDKVYEDSVIGREADIGIGVALTGVFLASAVYGFSATSRCTKLQKRLATLPLDDDGGDSDSPHVSAPAAQVPAPAPAPSGIIPPTGQTLPPPPPRPVDEAGPAPSAAPVVLPDGARDGAPDPADSASPGSPALPPPSGSRQ